MDREDTTDLLLKARAGSADALDALYERSARKLLPLIRLRMGPALRAHMESRDILQAALLKSFRKLADFEGSGGGSLMAWLARIAENEMRDQVDHLGRERRDVRRTVALEDRLTDLPSAARSALSQAILGQQGERLVEALEALPEHHREIIVLRKLEELTFVEIGKRLGKSTDACRMLFARAMAALTLEMAEETKKP